MTYRNTEVMAKYDDYRKITAETVFFLFLPNIVDAATMVAVMNT